MTTNAITLNETKYRVQTCANFLSNSMLHYLKEAGLEASKTTPDIRKVDAYLNLAHCNCIALEGVLAQAMVAQVDLEGSPRLEDVKASHDEIHKTIVEHELRKKTVASMLHFQQHEKGCTNHKDMN